MIVWDERWRVLDWVFTCFCYDPCYVPSTPGKSVLICALLTLKKCIFVLYLLILFVCPHSLQLWSISRLQGFNVLHHRLWGQHLLVLMWWVIYSYMCVGECGPFIASPCILLSPLVYTRSVLQLRAFCRLHQGLYTHKWISGSTEISCVRNVFECM